MNKHFYLVVFLLLMICSQILAQDKRGYTVIYGGSANYAKFNGDTSMPITGHYFPFVPVIIFVNGTSNICDSATRAGNPILENFYILQQQTNISRLYATNMALQALCDSSCTSDSQVLASRISAAYAANNSISNAQGYEWNEQWVNNLFIRSIELGTDSLSEAELMQLSWLAHSCPAIEGTAVWKARTLYSRYEPIASYDDNAICAQSPAYKQKQSDENMMQYMQNSYENALAHSIINKAPVLANNEVIAYPNPANDVIQIAYKFEKSEKRELIIYDVVGRRIWEQKINGTAAILPIRCKNWVPGIYHYTIKSKYEKYTGKIQIQ